jgi:hypothetical protein
LIILDIHSPSISICLNSFELTGTENLSRPLAVVLRLGVLLGDALFAVGGDAPVLRALASLDDRLARAKAPALSAAPAVLGSLAWNALWRGAVGTPLTSLLHKVCVSPF